MNLSTARRTEIDEAMRGHLSDIIRCFLGDTDWPGLPRLGRQFDK